MDLFSFIKNNVDILSTISEYTNLKKTGSLYWKGRCPFHNEKTASFTVSPHKNIFYCFGCHATGDVINFIEKIEHISPIEATQHLIQRYHLDIPKELQQYNDQPSSKTYYQLCYYVATWCNNMLTKNHAATDYLQQRNIQHNTIAHFLIGYFPVGIRNIQQLIAYIASHGFNTQDLIQANIVLQGKQGLYSPYENRIIFPIKDHIGHICGFGGRIFLSEDTRPKYYNSMDSLYFKKGKILFGMDSAKHEIQKKQTAFIVEGYMDCIALWQYGLKNSVATLGTAGSLEHLQQLTKHAQTIYLLYDADPAGKQAIMRLASSCWQLDLELKVVILPHNQDPASMLEQKIDIQPSIDQAQDIFNFFVETKSATFFQDSMKAKMATLAELLDVIAQTNDSLKQNILLMKASESLQIPLEILKNEYNKKYNAQLNDFSKKQQEAPLQLHNKNQALVKENNLLEEQITAALIHNPQLMTHHHELLLTSCLSDKNLQIAQAIIDHKAIHSTNCTHSTEEMVDISLADYVRTMIFKLHEGSNKQTFSNLMAQFQKKYWKSIASIIKMKIIQAKKNHDEQEIQRLLSVFEQLKSEVYKNGRL